MLGRAWLGQNEAFASLRRARVGCTILGMSLRRRFFAATYDRMSARAEKAGLASHRQLLLAGASGRVLEIGSGERARTSGDYGERRSRS